MHTVWKFETARFLIELDIEPVEGFAYDGDDEDGSIQAALYSGEFIAFDSMVSVTLKGVGTIGFDSLGSSVYRSGEESEFWTAHRDSDPMNRNCTAMRAARGANACIGHYFPDMVHAAIAQARSALCSAPRMRCAA